MSKYKAYPRYKDSGVEWLGEIPEHWELWKVIHACSSIGSGTTPKSDNDNFYGEEHLWVTTGELRENVIFDTKKKINNRALSEVPSLRLHPAGSVAIAMYGATIGRLGILGKKATTNQACCVIPPSEILYNKYLFYWLYAHKQDIINLSSGGGQPNINQEKVASLKISTPNFIEQTQIAHFLDHETARIDTLIAKQESLIALLKEKRQAVISHAVTKGLDPDVPMKDSGVEWLGEVPAHWKTLELKFTANSNKKSFTDGDWIESPYITESGVRLIQTGNVGIGDYREKGFKYISKSSLKKLNCTEIFHNDVLICRLDGPVGRACLVPDLGLKMVTSVDNAILKPNENNLPHYLVYLMSSSPWLNWIQNLCRVGGGFRFRISRTMLGNQKIVLPPFEEQKEICEFLNKQILFIDKCTEKSEINITLLKERRTALISAAVTGKIDVRDWTPPEPQSQKEAVSV